MSTIAVILVAGPETPLKSRLPEILQPVLGDPALLWVLQSLPPEVSKALVVAPQVQVQEATARWQSQGLLPCPVTLMDPPGSLDPGQNLLAAAAQLDRLAATEVLLLGAGLPQQGDAAWALPWRALKAALAGGGEFRQSEELMSASRRVPFTGAGCDPEGFLGMRSRSDQAALQATARECVNARWMEEGVTFLDPGSTYVGPRVTLAKDVLLEPGVRLEGSVTVGEGTRIGQGSVLHECTIGANVEIRPYCVIQQAVLGQGVKLGPFAHLREGSVLEANVHVGNFVETKKAILHEGAKANHLSYLGDSEVGARTNIGAGFISCNYDGVNKHRTIIGADVFVGSDCQLVAPVTLGDGSIIGAGSTITEDIPANALALSRAPLVVKEGAAERLRGKLQASRKRS